MSNRTERRHGSHSGSKPPAKRDPMINVYIGIGIAIVVVLAGLGFTNWNTQRIAAAQYAIAVATPTPGPNAKQKPIQLVDGVTVVGKPAFPPGNTKDGGNGSPVQGILCEKTEEVTLHIHAHLSIFDNGQQMQIPPGVGASIPTQCLYWLHTHDATGIIHVESPNFVSPNGGPFTLGMLFAIWGETLSRSEITRFKGPVTAYVNGAEYDGDLGAIPLLAHQQITLEVGKKVPPPNYAFGPAD